VCGAAGAKSKLPADGAEGASNEKPPKEGAAGGAGEGASKENEPKPGSFAGGLSSSNVKPKSVACAVPRPDAGAAGGGASTTNDGLGPDVNDAAGCGAASDSATRLMPGWSLSSARAFSNS